MIIVVVNTETDEITGRKKQICSHGYDTETGETVILPWVHPSEIGATWDPDLQEFVLKK